MYEARRPGMSLASRETRAGGPGERATEGATTDGRGATTARSAARGCGSV